MSFHKNRGPGSGFAALYCAYLSADGDPGERVDEPKHRIGDRAAHVVEVNVDPVRTQLFECLVVILRRLVIEARVEAEFLGEVVDLVVRTGDADNPATLDLGDLSDERADRAGCPGNDDRLAGLRIANVEQAKVAGESRHPQHAERCGDGHARRDIDLADAPAVALGILLPAEHPADHVAGRELSDASIR